MEKIKYSTVGLFLAIFFGCLSKKENVLYQRADNYQQSFKSGVALFTRERNGVPKVFASAFLIDRERGLFAYAKHFVGMEGDGNCKIFFNGKVYEGFLLKLPPVSDVAIIKISGIFNPNDLSESYRFAQGVDVNDRVFVRGIHPHGPAFLEKKIIVPILKGYYQMTWSQNEFVYDDLEAKVISLNKRIKNKELGITAESVSEISNSYIQLRTVEDHKFSFSGLSGGPTVNDRGEVVGINANETAAHFEINNRREIKYHPWDNMNLVPIAEVEKLMSHLANIK